MIVDVLIAIAPTAIGRSIPHGARGGGGAGVGGGVWGVAEIRFWTILRYVARDSSIAPTTSRGSLRTRTMPADSTATSVPAPIAIPTSAVARAGASLTPSPTIATLLPPSWNRRTAAAFSAGRIWAATS